MTWEFEELFYLLECKEDWLSKRILYYATNQRFTKEKSISTIDWTGTVNRLTDSMIQFIKDSGSATEAINIIENPRDKTVTLPQLSIQKLNPENKLSLQDSISILKMIRRAYLELITTSEITDELKKQFNNFLKHIFDWYKLNFINSIRSDLTGKKSMLYVDEFSVTGDSYKNFFDNFFLPVLFFNHKNSLVRANHAFNQLLSDLKINAETGELVTDQLPEQLRRKVNEFSKQIETDISYISSITTIYGTKQYKIQLKKIPDRNQVSIMTIAVLQDITAQLKTETSLQLAKAKAEKADMLKTAFLANMSHEIRTPMNAILGFTELMLNENFSSIDRTEYLKLIRKSSNDLLNIIEDIIDIAKIESKQLKIKYKPCKPFEILSDLKVVFDETLRRYGINQDVELILNIDREEQDLIFYTDSERLKQVMSNLLNNAAKFTNHGSIQFGYKRIDQSSIFFYVRDTGMGIPKDMKEKIFERFFQLEKHQTQNIGGSGLGLAICKNIVQLLGGNIWVESVEDKGSDFFFQIPYRDASKQLAEELKKPQETNAYFNWSSYHILIAEDDDLNFIYLKELLNKTGVKITRALNGLEAMNYVKAEEKINLILMDIKMPEVDGLEATRYIHSIRPDIPIIAQTAYAMEGDKLKCLAAGCCAYITKPVDRNKLLSLIQSNMKYYQKVIEQSSF